MKQSETRILPFDCRQLFDVVSDIERYPEFVPGWSAARIIDRRDNTLRVEQQFGLGPLNRMLVSRAVFDPPHGIHIHSDGKPFRRLYIRWSFSELPEDRCRVGISVDYELRPGLLRPLLEAKLRDLTSELARVFERRAVALYGAGSHRA